MSCYKCMYWHWRNRKYCPNCRPAPKAPTPDKTVLVIRASRTPEEEEKMNAAIERYRNIKPVFVFSSPAPEVQQVARRIAEKFGATVETSLLLRAGRGGANPRAVEILTDAKPIGLYICVAHEQHVKIAYTEHFRRFYCVHKVTPIQITHGDVLLIDFTARVVHKV